MSTHNLRRYLDLLNEADLVPPNAEVALPSSGTFTNDQALAAALAQENRCVKCGTPQAQHTGLKHAFAAEPGGGGITRIKQLQQELKAAGAALGATGAARDGIDGDLGPLTRAAAAKNPAIAAKYSDVLGTETATPASQATISQLTTALDTIEQILAKYKVKMSESRSVGNTDQMATWRDLMEITQAEADAAAAKRAAAQAAAQSTIDSRYAADAQAKKIGQYYGDTVAKTMPYSQAAQTATKGAVGSAGKVAATAAEKSAAKVAGKVGSKFIPGVALGIGALDAVNRYQKGDYAGAGIAAGAGLVSLIPFVGVAASLGLDAYNIYRDATNDPKINISPEDAAVLDQNLKAIQDLSKDPAVAAAITPEIRTRLERVIKAAATVIVADTPADGSQSATPVAAPDDLVKSVDGIEKILTKYQFEDVELANNVDVMTEHELRSYVLKNMYLLSESEQMAVRRDMINEILGAAAAAALAYKYGKSIAAKAAPAVAKAGTAAATTAATTAGTFGKKAWTAAKLGLGGTALYGVGQLYNMTTELISTMTQLARNANSLGQFGQFGPAATNNAGNYLTDQEKAELGQHAAVLEKYLKTPEDAAKLPPEIQQRLAAINTRMKNLVAAGVDR